MVGEQGVLPLAPRDAGDLPQIPQRLFGLTGRPYEASPHRAIHSTAWAWNPRAGLWQRAISRELYAIVSDLLTAPGWVAVIRVYGRGCADAAKAWVDEWADQAAGNGTVPGTANDENVRHAG